MTQLLKPLASLRLTLVLLVLSVILVFLGTMAQEPLGLYIAQSRYFQSAFVDLASFTAGVKKALQMFFIYLPPSSAAEVLAAPYIPVFPGGYLLGALLLVNLIAAHATRFKFTWKRSGILLVHSGIVLLLLGQLFTDLLARESAMRLSEGETRSYSEDSRRSELALVDVSDPTQDSVVAIPESLLRTGQTFTRPELPFQIKVHAYYPNSSLVPVDQAPNLSPAASMGLGTRYAVQPRHRTTALNERDVPSAIVELIQPDGKSLGSWLLSGWFLDSRSERSIPQSVEVASRNFQLSLRLRREYKDFSLTLIDFRHDKYPGTDKPKNYSSEVQLRNPKTGEDRKVLIYMNEPLRYAGYTFYQSSFDPRFEDVTILQVVRNPVWLTPYFACLVVGGGLLLQFGIHLVGFIRKKPPTPAPRTRGSPPRPAVSTPSALA